MVLDIVFTYMYMYVFGFWCIVNCHMFCWCLVCSMVPSWWGMRERMRRRSPETRSSRQTVGSSRMNGRLTWTGLLMKKVGRIWNLVLFIVLSNSLSLSFSLSLSLLQAGSTLWRRGWPHLMSHLRETFTLAVVEGGCVSEFVTPTPRLWKRRE